MKEHALFACVFIASVVGFDTNPAWGTPHGKQRARNHPTAPRPYVQAMTGWHAKEPGAKAPLDTNGRPMLVLCTINRSERLEVAALSDEGGFATKDLARIAHVLRSKGGDEHPVDPRTLNILYRIQTHFDAHELRIVSGYRTPKPNNHSNHGKGRAIDFVVPGAPDSKVAEYAREMGFVGVGIYPTSGFVHVDVRPRSYFWIDYSGPGKRNRERGILPGLAQKSDEQATARGQRGIEPFEIISNVDAHLLSQANASDTSSDDDGEEDESAD